VLSLCTYVRKFSFIKNEKEIEKEIEKGNIYNIYIYIYIYICVCVYEDIRDVKKVEHDPPPLPGWLVGFFFI